MDGLLSSISPREFYAQLGTASAPLVIDARSVDEIAASERLLPCAIDPATEDIAAWARTIAPAVTLVVYDSTHEESGAIVAALRRLGRHAYELAGGFAAWESQALPTRRKLPSQSAKWVTRERPKIDRIAYPWLIRRFIDRNAEFIYVPPADVLRVAKETGATPYDIDGVEFSHEGERCSFDTILRIYDIIDPHLHHLAKIVRGADTSRHDLAPQCSGLFAISLGLSANYSDDHEMLAHGMVMYDAVYAWCRSPQAETHNWPAKMLR